MKKIMLQIFMFSLLIVGLSSETKGIELRQSTFNLELQKVRYNNIVSGAVESGEYAYFENEFSDGGSGSYVTPKKRSPGVAFLMSLAVPGLGQFYNGSKIKAAAFLGFEVAGLVLNKKYDNEGDDLETEFQAFNRANWVRGRYETYEDYVIASNIETNGLSHHLPETMTQQYYEMTGKYDQFAWGWSDARIEGVDIDHLITVDSLEIALPNDESSVPHSDFRDQYEQMRFDSNQKYKSARTTLTLVMLNHLISGMEAFFTARSNNKRVSQGQELSNWKVNASMKSYYAIQDTPHLSVSYKF